MRIYLVYRLCPEHILAITLYTNTRDDIYSCVCVLIFVFDSVVYRLFVSLLLIKFMRIDFSSINFIVINVHSAPTCESEQLIAFIHSVQSTIWLLTNSHTIISKEENNKKKAATITSKLVGNIFIRIFYQVSPNPN